MKLLFITQKLHGQDAFGALWIEAFARRGYDVTALCLEWREEDALAALGRTAPFPFRVVSLGKENGRGKIRQAFRFLRLIFTIPHDRVFIHMAPVWGLLGAPVWILRRTPVYLWYTHYKMQAGLWLLGWYGRRLFCATAQSLPQYEGNPKKVIVGHGIDTAFWPRRENVCADPLELLVVHRLSRSKRLELVLRALTHLPQHRLTIYGIEAEPEYVRELRALAEELGITDRVTWKGSAPMKDLPAIYTQHRFILNLASETIDKTMLEAMTCGCYPVTTKRNAAAIGLCSAVEQSSGRQVGTPAAPDADTPEAIAAFVAAHAGHLPLTAEEMDRIVRDHHSLEGLIGKMDGYIRSGR